MDTLTRESEPRTGPGADRRIFPRFSAPTTVPGGGWSRVLDLSLGGACLEGSQPVERGERIDVILTDCVHFHTAMLEAEVVWQHGSRVGLRWVQAGEREQEWLENRCR